MKNIHKIIESPTEIMDKCAWWYNTITGETLRWNGTIWEAISSQGGSSSEPLEAGEGITIENNTISTNVGGDIVVSGNNNLSIWQIPGVKRVRFLNKGRVDLNRKYEVGLVPPSTKSRFIRFIHTDIASQYTETVTIPENPYMDKVIDASSQLLKRQGLVNKTQVFLNDTLVQFDIQYKLKMISTTAVGTPGFVPHRVSPKNSLWDDSGLTIYNPHSQGAQFKAIPYIVILNPFIEYGGKVTYQYKVENGNYIIKVKTEDIKHKEVLFDTKGQQYLEFQEAQQGKISCVKGSFTPKKYLYTYRNKVSNNANFQQLFTHRKINVIKYNNNFRFSYEKVLDYVTFLYAFATTSKWRKYFRRKIIVMCIDKLAKHKFSGLEEREVWVDKNLARHAGHSNKVGHKIFRIQ